MTKLNVDCLILIFDEFQYDKNSLYSCLLVNKKWCNIVVPILWKNHFWRIERPELEKKLYNVILSWLPSSSKQLLFNNNIKLPSVLKPPLFNYISFCTFPNASIIDGIIKMVELNNDNHKRNLLEQEIYKLFVSQCKGIKRLWWKTSQPLSLFPGASSCFSQLCGLCLELSLVNPNYLYEMAQICRDLNRLDIHNHSQNLSGLIALIDAKRNLKSVDNHFDIKKELSKTLERKGNTTNDLGLSFHLTSFINLKEISFDIHGEYEYEDFREVIKKFRQYLEILEFPDLQKLHIKDYSGFFSNFFRELAMLIEKTRGNISQLQICFAYRNKEAKNTGMLIKAIANNCPNIEVLSTYLIPDDFIHFKLLLINCRSLARIVLNFFANENEIIGDELLNILARFSQNSLSNVTINGHCKYSNGAFEQFFESYRKRTELCFFISNNDFITEDHKVTIRKYIREKVLIDTNLRYY